MLFGWVFQSQVVRQGPEYSGLPRKSTQKIAVGEKAHDTGKELKQGVLAREWQ